MPIILQSKSIIFIVAITVLTVIGDAYLKKSGDHARLFANKEFILGLGIYCLTAFLWVFVYRNVKFSLSGVIYSILTMLLFVLFGVFFFHETLSKTEYIGLVFGAISLFLLSRFV